MTQWGLDTLFNPAKRHMDEEKRRLQSTREEVGDNSGGKRVDLESGRVRIRRDGESGEGAEPGSDTAVAVDAESDPDTARPDETPAMHRARLRRAAARKPKAKPQPKPVDPDASTS